MIEYLQPDFYHFTEDSILFSKWLATTMSKTHLSYLELGAGCGVITYELINLNRSLSQARFTLLEKQKEFLHYLMCNKPKEMDSSISILIQDCESFIKNELSKYDVIYANLPYYLEQEGRHPINVQQMICNFMSDSLYQALNKLVLNNLKIGGEFYFMCKKYGKLKERLLKDLKNDCFSVKEIELRSKDLVILVGLRLNIN